LKILLKIRPSLWQFTAIGQLS